jgi:hypothetical protein
MDREQAIRIQERVYQAGIALDRASMLIAGLAKKDRVRLGDVVDEIISALRSDLLAAIHEQHPDLGPPHEEEEEEAPEIDSRLQWEDVRLPPSVSASDIDAILFSVMRPHWRKVAMVVAQGVDRCKELGIPVSYEVLAARLQVLAEAGHIEDFGDLRMWRFSEVRLKD